ncbi:MAG: SDR family NAD(P)-dependent oxidoreductase [Xanthomonadaceae bacterium]|nr:SDR family NAD(P)-dependent oxidoreductase [Xanthomonadaceae bacterium]
MIAVVTGVSSGFGLAIARRLVHEGYKVIGIARREEKLKTIEAELGTSFLGLAVDVTDQPKITHELAHLPQGFRDITLLVNNAGLALGLDLAQNAQLSDWDQMVKTNINGVLNCTHAILPGMVKRERGHIINMGSVAAEFPYPGGNVYGATKAFIRQLSLNLRADLHGTPIRVTDIEPGLCSGTEFSVVRFKNDEARAKQLYEGTTPITPEDIAETVYWCTSLPAHVNINTISMMPVSQSFGALPVKRN